MISSSTTMPENFQIVILPCSLPPAERAMMIKGDVNTLAILDTNLDCEMILGHNFYHTFNRDKTTSPVTASITTINEKKRSQPNTQ